MLENLYAMLPLVLFTVFAVMYRIGHVEYKKRHSDKTSSCSLSKRVSLKIKGDIDVKKSTLESIKMIEKKGVKTNVLIGAILDGFDYDSVLKQLDENDKPEVENNGEASNENGGMN